MMDTVALNNCHSSIRDSKEHANGCSGKFEEVNLCFSNCLYAGEFRVNNPLLVFLIVVKYNSLFLNQWVIRGGTDVRYGSCDSKALAEALRTKLIILLTEQPAIRSYL